jgi:adenosylcobinamide-phosphate synthase
VLSGLDAGAVGLLMAAGVVLDLLLGEARRWHPLVGFGNWAMWLERRLNRDGGGVVRGALAWLLAVAPPTACAIVLVWLAPAGWITWLAQALLLYLCLGLRSLREHNLPIADALARHDLAAARRLTACIVSRDTSAADASALAKASAESLLENGNDAVFGTLFWFVLAGAPGAVMYRAANTLDAMWGYRSSRYLQFGRVAARLDDLFNLAPARLTALSYVLLARGMHAKRRAWLCWRMQAPLWSSPNAGPVMASGAGALGIELGGAAIYDGELEQRPPLGHGSAAGGADIVRAWRLVARTTALWLAVALTTALLTELQHA